MTDPIQWPSFDQPNNQPPLIKRATVRPPKLRKRRKNDTKKGRDMVV